MYNHCTVIDVLPPQLAGLSWVQQSHCDRCTPPAPAVGRPEGGYNHRTDIAVLRLYPSQQSLTQNRRLLPCADPLLCSLHIPVIFRWLQRANCQLPAQYGARAGHRATDGRGAAFPRSGMLCPAATRCPACRPAPDQAAAGRGHVPGWCRAGAGLMGPVGACPALPAGNDNGDQGGAGRGGARRGSQGC